MNTRQSLYFIAPRQVAVQDEDVPDPGMGEARVEVLLSAISPGTEGLVYRGTFPHNLVVDEGIAALSGKFGYPLKYGYATVGHVAAVGEGVDPAWEGQLVFAFQPHHSQFVAPVDSLLPVPHGVGPEDAVFLPNMETAVNFVMDGRPLIGEQVVVLGQGVVGLLTTSLLAQFPLAALITLDRYLLRRQASLRLSAHTSLDPLDMQDCQQLAALLPDGADLCYELTGSPAALDEAIALTGFDGRIVIGSWYGQKRASLDLGGRFHRSRLRLISSQVTTLASEFSGRWSKERRFSVAWEMLRAVRPAQLVTQRFPIRDAAAAYQLIDQHPEETVQVLLTYP
jgi:2-desacetyl-2-hydroxyethyl bacteriochlorophyllide A dehydrogenase